METAHLAVERANFNLERIRKECERAKSMEEKHIIKTQWDKCKVDMDAAYTELKQAQDATSKALAVKRQQLEKYLSSQSSDPIKKMDHT